MTSSQANPPTPASYWTLILAASAVLMVTVGVRLSLGLYVSPINTATGIGITGISFAMAVSQFVWGASQPVFGAIADRYGPAGSLFGGAVLMALGLALAPFVESEFALTVTVGLLVAAGWWLTAHIGVDEFEPARLTSLSFIGPIAETLLYLQLSVGREPGIGLALTAGVLAGAFLAALGSRTARWEGFDSTSRLAASAGGGLLMGVGGVLAAGCSIGQGLSGLSTLSLASFAAVAGILLGALLSLRLLRQQ